MQPFRQCTIKAGSRNLSSFQHRTHAPLRQVITRAASNTSNEKTLPSKTSPTQNSSIGSSAQQEPKKKKKSQAELDRELELKMQGLAGDGGEAGVELEDGQPVAMKRSVRNNMFRYI